MSILKRTAAILAAGAMLLTAVSCGNKQDDSSSTVELTGDNGKDYAENVGDASEDDLPYGATIYRMEKQYDPEALITTEFDRRFFTEKDETYPEIHKIINYMYSLNNVDAELMEASFYPPYLEKMVKNSGASDTKAYIQQYYDNLKAKLGAGFVIDYMEITNCRDESDPDIAEYFKSLDEAIDEACGEKVSERVTSRKMATVAGYSTYNLDGNSYVLMEHLDNEINFAIYEIDGEYWIV